MGREQRGDFAGLVQLDHQLAGGTTDTAKSLIDDLLAAHSNRPVLPFALMAVAKDLRIQLRGHRFARTVTLVVTLTAGDLFLSSLTI